MKIFMFLASLALFGCKATVKAILPVEQIVESEFHEKVDSFLYSDSGVLIKESYFNKHLRCGNLNPISIDSIRHMTPFSIEVYVDDCIKLKVYNGYKAAEPFLVGFLKTQKDQILPYKSEEYRGEKVFKALLDLASSTKCADDAYHTIYGRAPLNAVYEMVKSYDGFTNFQEFKNNTPLLQQIKRPGWEKFECSSIAFIKMNHNLIKLAWEKGLIILKDYGEE